MSAEGISTAAASPPAAAIDSEYKQSIHRILAYIGLQGYGTPAACMPRRTEAEQAIVDAHVAAVQAQSQQHAERNRERAFQNAARKRLPGVLAEVDTDLAGGVDSTIYLASGDSVEWRAFMVGLPANQRHIASARRRLSTVMWRSHKKGLCLYCWMPSSHCLCGKLAAYRAAMPADELVQSVPVTMLLHPEEMMRSTNSGHIAAFLLDAPLRVWGVPDDDAFLEHLPEVSHPPAALDDATFSGKTLNVSLYPAHEAETVGSFIQTRLRAPATLTDTTVSQRQRVHLILLDSTWQQAHSLNRHIAAQVPRVALEIPPDYEARFARLRKRTRETGVSTLEATNMAVEQCLVAMGKPEAASSATAQLVAAMEEFVDLKCLLKFTDVEFTKDEAMVRELTAQRDVARREQALRRLAMIEAKVLEDETARRLLVPPVLKYCYCCDRFIGWNRMPEHVVGRQHRAALARNPTCEPTEASRRKWKEWRKRRESSSGEDE